MSDRYLRGLLREAQQGLVPLQDYVAAALRVMPLEAVIVDLDGFRLEDIRLAVRLVWIPVYAAQNKAHKRVTLAGVLGDPIAKRVAPSRRKNDFPNYGFFERNQSLLSDKDWRLFAADCAEHVLYIFESAYPNDDRPRKAIETARRYDRGEVTVQELEDAGADARSAARSATSDATRDAALSATWSTIAWDAAYQAARSAADYAAYTAAAWSSTEQVEISWQAVRLADYLTGLSALPWPP